MTSTITTDVCVIGAGSGGLSFAAGAVQMGARVVLLEGHKMGGDCLNYGCVPSKALIAAAKHAHAMTTGEPFGIGTTAPEVDYAAVMEHVASVIRGIEPHDSVERFSDLGVHVITEFGRFVSPREVVAGDHRIRARRFVIATGSSPFVPPVPGLDQAPHMTNETVFSNREKPEHLIVMGAGPIGLELAQAHQRLGCRVTVIEGLVALGNDDPELTSTVIERLTSEGVELHQGAFASAVEGSEGNIRVTTDNGAVYEGSHLLVAVGRVPNTERLDLDAGGIAMAGRAIKVDASLRTSNRRVLAIGDVAGRHQFTHVASYHASTIIKSVLFGLPSKVGDHHIPWVTYTDPELAHVGFGEAAAKKLFGTGIEVVRFSYGDNDRARAELATEGMIKLVVHRGRPVGATIVGKQAGELIQVWALAIANRLKMSAVAGMISPYPTLGEINKRAAGQYFAPRLFGSAMVKRVVRTVQRFGR